jgi:hypothetical protein
MGRIKHITEPFGPTLEATVRIRPEMEIDTLRTSDGREYETVHLRFYVECGKDSWGTFSAEGFWAGPREGPEWEDFKAHWQSQLDYISRYLGGAVHRAGLQLCHENAIANRQNHPEWRNILVEYSEDLKAFDKHGGNVDIEITALRNTYGDMPLFQWLVGWWAYSMRARLLNKATLQTGSNDKLRFSYEMVKTYQSIFPELCKVWKMAKKVIRENRIHWKIVVKERFATANLPDDLLDAAADNPEYRPAQLARVHAARVAGFKAYLSTDYELTMAQERTIREEIKEYLAAARGNDLRFVSTDNGETD